MSLSKIKKQLRETKRDWERGRQSRDLDGGTGFIPGVGRGLREAIAIIERYQREEVARARAERKPLSRWSAKALYQACRSAYQRLEQSDRAGAMRALQRAIRRIDPRAG